VIGEYCDGCHTFWPLSEISGRKRFYAPRKSVSQTTKPVAPDIAEEPEMPEFVREMLGLR